MAQPLWWQTGVMYNLYVRSFRDTNGDGIGDLTGVIEKLDYLSNILGVDIIWLSGMLASPWKEFGFDVSDFRNVHPAMGTLEVFDELLRQAHARGMKVVIDFIPNHTSDQHAWFLESRSSRTNPKRDWYIWRDPKPDGSPPSNWLCLFGGSAWEWDEYTWQYYLHSFLKEQPDLNWRSPEVEKAMFDVARFWLDRGVDGFRVDAAHHILKDEQLRDNPPNEPRTLGGKRMVHEYQQHLYNRERPGVHEIYQRLRKVLDEYSQDQPRAMFAEVHVRGGWKEWARYFGPELNEFHYPFNNGFISLKWDAQEARKLLDDVEGSLPKGAWPNAHIGNYDEWRLATRYGPQQARVAAMLLLTMRGAPLMYYGEEIGMINTPIPPEYDQDPSGKNIRFSRDPQRTPMQWDAGAHAGFSVHTTPRLWLPIHSNFRSLNVESELADSRSILNLYRRLIALRKQSPVLQLGSYQAIDSTPPPILAYLRELEGERVLIALNFSGEEVSFPLAQLKNAHLLLSTELDRQDETFTSSVTLRGNEGVLLSLA